MKPTKDKQNHMPQYILLYKTKQNKKQKQNKPRHTQTKTKTKQNKTKHKRNANMMTDTSRFWIKKIAVVLALISNW